MNSQELLNKLVQSNEKVEKRLTTISKLCVKLNVNLFTLMESYREVANSLNQDWMPSKTSCEIVSNLVNEKEERDVNGDWNEEAYTFNGYIRQLSDNLVKLFEVERIAYNWQVKYDTQKNKEEAPKIEVLWNFLNNWESKAIEWYLKNAESYFNLRKNYENEKGKYLNSEELKEIINFIQNNEYQMKYYRTIERAKDLCVNEWEEKYYSNINSLTKDITHIKHEYVYPNPDNRRDYKYVPVSYSVDKEKLSKVIAQEKQYKYEDLCNRISEVVGEITDVSNLSVGNQQGELNGIVEGKKGTAKVETVGAGGDNVGRIVNVKCGQCFHYRVLVHKLS